jgi:hypothetical protein
MCDRVLCDRVIEHFETEAVATGRVLDHGKLMTGDGIHRAREERKQ